MSASAIILFAHGARDPQWAVPLQQLAEQVAAQRPNCRVALAFLELMTPSLADCIADMAQSGVADVLIVPAFISRGAHLRRDLPLLIDQLRVDHPTLSIRLSDALGEAAPVQTAMAAWIGSL